MNNPVRICNDSNLNRFIFRQYRNHAILLFYCLFCRVHAIKYSNIYEKLKNYRCLDHNLQFYDTVLACLFLELILPFSEY